MVFLYSDVLYRYGGIETYLHALALHLKRERILSRVAVAELQACPLVDELVAKGITAYRQRRLPGDRWLVRQRAMMAWLSLQLTPNDWVFCVRHPMPELYAQLSRLTHRRGAKIAVSWMLAPEFLPPSRPDFCQAVAETDAVISVSHCTVNQFESVYGYSGAVHVVPYHNFCFFDRPLPLPSAPPWKIGYMGRLEKRQKNLDHLVEAFASLAHKRRDIELHLYGGGPDQPALEQQVVDAGMQTKVFFHGPYDHRRDLEGILAKCHFFVCPSRYEGAPFSLLEIMQAGRFCVASRVGGIPDLYEGRPGIGSLVTPDDVSSLCAKLEDAIEKIAAGLVDGEAIRARYFEAFDINAAHRAWLSALSLDGVRN